MTSELIADAVQYPNGYEHRRAEPRTPTPDPACFRTCKELSPEVPVCVRRVCDQLHRGGVGAVFSPWFDPARKLFSRALRHSPGPCVMAPCAVACFSVILCKPSCVPRPVASITQNMPPPPRPRLVRRDPGGGGGHVLRGLVRGAWCVVHGVWCVVLGAWCVVCGARWRRWWWRRWWWRQRRW